MNNNKNNNNLLAFTTAMWPDITPSRCMFYISFFFIIIFQMVRREIHTISNSFLENILLG